MELPYPYEHTLEGLPAELFRKIVGYAMPDEPAILNADFVIADTKQSSANLLLVNRTFYRETSHLLYRQTECTVLLKKKPTIIEARLQGLTLEVKYPRTRAQLRQFSRVHINIPHLRDYFDHVPGLRNLASALFRIRSQIELSEISLRITLSGPVRREPIPSGTYSECWSVSEVCQLLHGLKYLHKLTRRSAWSFIALPQLNIRYEAPEPLAKISEAVTSLFTYVSEGGSPTAKWTAIRNRYAVNHFHRLHAPHAVITNLHLHSASTSTATPVSTLVPLTSILDPAFINLRPRTLLVFAHVVRLGEVSKALPLHRRPLTKSAFDTIQTSANALVRKSNLVHETVAVDANGHLHPAERMSQSAECDFYHALGIKAFTERWNELISECAELLRIAEQCKAERDEQLAKKKAEERRENEQDTEHGKSQCISGLHERISMVFSEALVHSLLSNCAG